MAIKQGEIYVCEVPASCCGEEKKGCLLMVEAVLSCDEECDIVCCDKPMSLLQAKGAAQEGKEKHVPVVEKIDGGYKVTVGSVPHPMEDAHYIQWIELVAGPRVYREYLKPGQPAEAVFKIDAENVTAREHCNKHGLWQA
jgi:superoxide reductase